MRRVVSSRSWIPAVVLLAPIVWLALPTSCDRVPDVTGATKLERAPRIDPDYTSLVVPPNIAPLNFRIMEVGVDYLVRVSSERGATLDVPCRDGKCRIPVKPWRRLLEASRGGRLAFDVFARPEKGAWVQFGRITNTVAEAPIDSYVVYRRITPSGALSRLKGVYQRHLESFRVSALITTRDERLECFNCHTFHNHDPNRFLVHTRLTHTGMNLVRDGEVRKIDTQQGPMFRPLAYASWHPGGRHIAATCNRFLGHMPSNSGLYPFQALEKRGDLVVYDVQENTISTSAAVFEHRYIETHPCWSPDGQHIYFSRGEDFPVRGPEDWEKSDFDLMRIAYDVDTGTWGLPETVKAYSELGVSCAFPRPSPCGRYVLHILSDKTTYPIHQKSSDVYLLDLASNQHRRLDAVCSDRAESYPRWSSNGRWFTFLSSRRDALSALPYIAYFDVHGQAHKAFVVPQKDPEYYGTFIDTYNVLEPVKSRVNVSTFKLAMGLQQPARAAKFPNPPRVDAYTGPTKPVQGAY